MSCASCDRPFDATDTRFDGYAQHRDTPWCRRCVDLCHESVNPDHRCPVCARQLEQIEAYLKAVI